MIQKIVDPIARWLVGGLFIFSGLIKLNDPLGTEIKMEEYFEVFATDFSPVFQYFIPWSLTIAMVMIILEITLGVAILIRYRMKLTTWVLLGLMVFFTFLTFYSAYFEKVTDCGCFGDAIKLTPWESFWKDVFLMVFVLHLFWYRRQYTSIFSDRAGHIWVAVSSVVCLGLGVYAIEHLPFIDFRAYRVGNNIPRQMQPPEEPIIEYVFLKDGKEVRSQLFLMPENGYEFKSSHVINEDRIKPKITDYSVVTPDGVDITKETFQGPRLFIVAFDINKTSTENLEAIGKLVNELQGKVQCLLLTSSPYEATEAFRHAHQLAVPFAYADATVLKTIIRSNPGISLWKDGTVLGNWHHNDTPGTEEVLELLVKTP